MNLGKNINWGANIEVYQIIRVNALDEVTILNELNIHQNEDLNDYNKSIFDMTLNSDISIIKFYLFILFFYLKLTYLVP